MKQTLSILLACSICFVLMSCGGVNNASSSQSGNTQSTSAQEPSQSLTDGPTATIALLEDVTTPNEKVYYKAAWAGLERYAQENLITYKAYTPKDKTTAAYLQAIAQAVEAEAAIIIAPCAAFAKAISTAAGQYPQVNFILLDGVPTASNDPSADAPNIPPNLTAIRFAEEEAGFLAGYAAVKSGATQLGFLGGEVLPWVQNYGFGFVQGAEYAAQQAAMPANSITLTYTYTYNFDHNAENQTLAASWYNGGTQIIFACGGQLGNAAMAAAEACAGQVIGVDVDQSWQSPQTVVASAIKGLDNAVYLALERIYKQNKGGGTTLRLTAKENGIGLHADYAKLNSFTVKDYEQIYEKLISGQLSIKTASDNFTLEDLTLTKVKLKQVG